MKYSRRIWMCPFFKYDKSKKQDGKRTYAIYCTAGRMCFGSLGTYRDFACKYCCDVKNWAQCPHAAAAEELSEECKSED